MCQGRGWGTEREGDPHNGPQVAPSQTERAAGIIRKSGKRKERISVCHCGRDIHWACGRKTSKGTRLASSGAIPVRGDAGRGATRETWWKWPHWRKCNKQNEESHGKGAREAKIHLERTAEFHEKVSETWTWVCSVGREGLGRPQTITPRVGFSDSSVEEGRKCALTPFVSLPKWNLPHFQVAI